MAEHRLSYTAEEIDERLGTVNDNKQNILNLTNRVVENENDIDAVEANVSTLSAEMSTAKTDIDNLETQVTTNKQNIDTNATAIQTNATAISDLNTNMNNVLKLSDVNGGYIRYVRQSDTIMYFYIRLGHPTVPPLIYDIKFYTMHPNMKLELVQTQDGGKNWSTIWYVAK